MGTTQIILLAVFIFSSIVGYFLIKNVPSLLHTPLMSGMNALSGITLIGALIAFGISAENTIVSSILSAVAIVVSTINVVGGFGITDRMLKMFKKEGKDND